MKRGDAAIWTGTSGRFRRQVTITAARKDYLVIMGERPEDGRDVYDIHDPVIGGTVYGIPAEQLQAATCTCEIDGYTEDGQGRERYWHCEQPSIAVLPDGTNVCKEHVLDAMDNHSC